MSIDYKVLGRRIKLKRKSQSITQEKLAEKLSVSVGYMSQIERGITRVNLDMLSNISLELHCDISELLTGTAPSGENYLKNELETVFNDLDNVQRKMLLKIANIIKSG